MNGVLLGILAYLAVQLAIGFYVSRRVRSESDYLLAGRSLGWGLSIFTVFATWFGAETCIGAAGQAYAKGLAGVTSDPFGYALALVLFGLLFAAPLYARRLTTLADLFRERFGVAAERVAVLLMVPTSVMWAAAQIRAFGQVLGHAGGLDAELAITLAALVVIVYTTAGGLLADAWTDLLQGIVLIVGLVMLLVVMAMGGALDVLAQVPAVRLDPIGAGTGMLEFFEHVAPPLFGSLVAQELVQRASAARSQRIARRSAVIAGCIYLVVGLIPVIIGLAASAADPGVEESEQILLVQASVHLPTLGYVVFAGALVSAILSTVDTALLVAGALFSHNLVVPLLQRSGRPHRSPLAEERRKLLASRLAVGAFGVVAYLLALSAESVYRLVEQASAFGSAGVFVVVVFALWTSIGTSASAIGALVTGSAVHVLAGRLELAHPYGLALATALVVFVGTAWAQARRRGRGLFDRLRAYDR